MTIPCPEEGNVVHYALNSEEIGIDGAGETLYHVQFREIRRLEVTAAKRRKAKLTYHSVDNELIGARDTPTWNIRATNLEGDPGTLGALVHFRKKSFEFVDVDPFVAFTERSRWALFDAVSDLSDEEQDRERRDDTPAPVGLDIRAGLDPASMSLLKLQEGMLPLLLASCGTFEPDVLQGQGVLKSPNGRSVPASAKATTDVHENGLVIRTHLQGQRPSSAPWRDLVEVLTIRAADSSPWPEWEAVTTWQEGESTFTSTTSMKVVSAP
ncbi:MAG: hypothetical protein KTR31_16175 [Myxococcales bacterium]|nr:hypothetical protein [Myxococcales bacterium]